MRRVAVLAAEGFLGSNVLAALQAAGGMQVTGCRGTALPAEPVDAIVNCQEASVPAIRATARALAQRAVPGANLPLMVHVGSMTVYGAATGRVDEDAPLREDFGPYASAQVEAERLLRNWPRPWILRAGCEFGPGGHAWTWRVARWLLARRLGDLGASGDGLCNLVHVGDLAAAVLACLRAPEGAGTTLNIAQQDPPTWNEFLVAYARALGAVPVRRIGARRLALESRVLAPALKVLELAADRAGLASWVPPAIPPSFLRLARQEIRLDTTRAQALLDWRARDLAAALADGAAWAARTDRAARP